MATVVLVTVEHAGRTWRLSSRPISITDATGVSRLYRGGIAPMEVYAEAVMFGEGTVQSQTFELLPDVSIAGLVDEGHLSSEIHAEVATIEDGQALDMRRIRLTGRASVESDGRRGKPLRLSVSGDDPAKSESVYPPMDAAFGSETWGGSTGNRYYDQAAEGSPYQTALGRAGRITSGGSPADLAAVPAQAVGFNTAIQGRQAYVPWGRVADWAVTPFGAAPYEFLFLSYGWLYPGDGANKGRITVFLGGSAPVGGGPPESFQCSMHYFLDALGQKCTLAWATVGAGEDWPVSGTGNPFQAGRTYYYALREPCSGIPRNDYLGGLAGAGEIVRWALERSSVTVDWRRATPALEVLDRYELAGFWDQPCSPWAWLVDNVFPLLPCSWVSGPHGVYPVVWRLDATIHDCDCPPLIDGLNCSIDGPITYEGDPVSAFALEYAQGLYGGTFRRSASWHGGTTRASTRESMNLHLRRAQQRYGTQVGAEVKPIESLDTTDLVYSDRSSDRILGWKSRALPEPRRKVRIVGDGLHHRAHLANLQPGMAVPFESAAESITRRVAYVSRVGRLGALIYADLVILSQP